MNILEQPSLLQNTETLFEVDLTAATDHRQLNVEQFAETPIVVDFTHEEEPIQTNAKVESGILLCI